MGWLALGCLDRVDILLAGGNPLAAPAVEVRVDQAYTRSPLEVALELEQAARASAGEEVDVSGVLAFGDAVSDELARWLLARTGAQDLHEAERALWGGGSPDPLVIKWASILQQRGIRLRRSQRLSAGIPASGPVYAHPDEAVLLFAHAAWRMDLHASLVRSPVHHYVHLHEPGGRGIRGVEPTCIWRLDRHGTPTGSDERCQGPLLVFDEHHHPSGRGHIPPPEPPLPGTYEEVTDEQLQGDLLARLVARGVATSAVDGRTDPSPALVRALWSKHLREGISAAEATAAGEVEDALAVLEDLRAHHGDVLPPAPDEAVLRAALAAQAGRSPASALAPIWAHYEPAGPVEIAGSAAHAHAMWLDLTTRSSLRPEDWNARIIPLMNRHARDPERFAELCELGGRALAGTTSTLEEIMPDCAP